MKNIIFSYFIIHFVLIYLYSTGSLFKKIFKIHENSFSNIIIGYSLICLILYYLYFFIKLDNNYIYFFLALLTPLIIYYFKEYIRSFFFNKINIFISLIILIFVFAGNYHGEQFYVFRGNYWDSFNYLSSAVLFKNYNFTQIINNSIPDIYFEFRNIDHNVVGRPLVNYLLSFFLNNKLNIFFSYYLFKIFLTVLIFISLKDFLKLFFRISDFKLIILSICFIFSFWNIYVFEIDALSHFASIPILLITIKYIFKLFDEISKNNKNFIFCIINSSSLFIIYPEIIIIPAVVFIILLIINYNKLNFKISINFLYSIFFFIILTIPSIETNYKYLFTTQIGQALRSSNWWGYFGSFLLGRENLVLDVEFVQNFKNLINTDSSYSFLNFLHQEHFKNNFYFIYLNIFPSLTGLYYVLPGKIENNTEFFYQLIILLILYFYILLIIYKNLTYILSLKKYKNFFLILILSIICLTIYLFYIKSFWTILKIFTYIFPFIFIFFSINFSNNKLNSIYIIFMLMFFFYKYYPYNYGIGRLDSFPSIINSDLKTKVNWKINNQKLKKCKNMKYIDNNYIRKTYINLSYLNSNMNEKNIKYKKKNCIVLLENKNFKILYE